MNWFQRIRIKLKEQLVIAASNPENFEEKWRFSSSRIQLFSLAIIVFIVSGLLFTLLISYGLFSGFVSEDDASLERKKLEKQYKEIRLLSKKVEAQENYIKNLSKVISGDIPTDSIISDLPDPQKIIQPRLESTATKSERELHELIQKKKTK